MVRGDFQPARNHGHDGDELALFGQNQLLFLALVLRLHPGGAGSKLRLFVYPAAGKVAPSNGDSLVVQKDDVLFAQLILLHVTDLGLLGNGQWDCLRATRAVGT